MTSTAHLDATRAAYDAVAVRYAELFRDAMAEAPVDRAMIAAFAELVRSAGAGQVADLGCGPGRMTAYLRSLGLDVFGVDLSPTMIAIAREKHPELRFEEGEMTSLDLTDGALGGILSWYSVIHTPPEELPAVLAEYRRVLRPGGYLLVGFFHSEDEPVAFDHKVTLGYRWPADRLASLLDEAGFAEIARLVREPGPSERFRQGHLLAAAA